MFIKLAASGEQIAQVEAQPFLRAQVTCTCNPSAFNLEVWMKGIKTQPMHLS